MHVSFASCTAARPVRRTARSLVGVVASVAFTAIVGFAEPSPDPEVHQTTVAVPDGHLAGAAATPFAVTGGPELVGFTWQSATEARFEVRARDAAGWSDWFTLEGEVDEAPDASAAEWTPTGHAGPAFLGRDIVDIEVRLLAGDPPGLVIHAIDSEPTAPTDGVATAAQPPPFIISRAEWGADESWRDDSAGCDGNPRFADNIQVAVVHHTVSRNDYSPAESAAIVRGVYDFHVHSNGWCDVGYNFFVDRFGRIFEGRFGGPTRAVVGGHTSGINSVSTGVAAIGNFETAAVPGATYDGIRAILAFKLAYHGVNPEGASSVTIGANTSSRWPEGTTVTLPNIEGHRDSNTTACPGRYLYAMLARLRADVAATTRTFPSDVRLVCDWDGDGTDELGYFANGAWYLPNGAFDWPFTADFGYGNPGDVPVCGDWDGNGTDTPGVFRNGAWYLRNSVTTGVADLTFGFGDPRDMPIVGDWTGSGVDRPGVYRAGGWYLRTSPVVQGGMVADISYGYGNGGDQPLVGDWDGNGTDTPAVYRHDSWYLRNANTTGVANLMFGYGIPGDRPVAGDFNGGGGPDGVGVVRGSVWYLRYTPNPGFANAVIPF